MGGGAEGIHNALTGQSARRPGGSDGIGPLLDPQSASDPYPALTRRGLKSATLRRYGYFVTRHNGKSVHVAPYYDQQGALAGQKLRGEDKAFFALKASPDATSIGECRLFGQQVYGDKYDKRVVITEGELDAMSVAQEMDFSLPCLSVNTGSKGAAKCLKQNWLWLDRFEEIVLWFDDDEPGREAAEECAQLFAVGKVRLAKLAGCKDASDALQQGRPGDIKSAIFSAVAWRPAGIVNAADNEDDVLTLHDDVGQHAWRYDWPWKGVQETFGPILPGQVCYHVAGTGIGKSSALAEVEACLIKQGCKVAHFGLEDTRRDAKLRLLSIDVDRRLEINPLPDEEMRVLHRRVFGSRLIELFDPETAEWSVNAIMGYVRYCAKALDCQVVVIDPLSFVAAGLDLSDDERRALDKASRDLAALAKELGIHIQIAHHLKRPEGTAHEEGAATSLNQVRGSGGIANFATFVIGHERNQQAEGDQWLLTQLRALKNRPRSVTGPMEVLRYSTETGRLLPTKEPFPQPSSSKRGRPSFGPANGGGGSDDY